MGLKPTDLSSREPDKSLLGSWTANLLLMGRYKCVLFFNEETYFNFIVPDVLRKHIKDLSNMFVGNLSCVLADEGVPEQLRQQIIAECAQIEFCNTNSRQILGMMNQFARYYENAFCELGSLHSCEIPNVIRNANRMLAGMPEYKTPIIELQKRLGLPIKKAVRLF